MKRIYLAGPMTNLPFFNYPAFDEETGRLVALGYTVENPAANPEPACKSWEGYMRLALTQLVRCDTLALLPNWGNSRGATIEHRLAGELGIRVVLAHEIVASIESLRPAPALKHCHNRPPFVKDYLRSGGAMQINVFAGAPCEFTKSPLGKADQSCRDCTWRQA